MKANNLDLTQRTSLHAKMVILILVYIFVLMLIFFYLIFKIVSSKFYVVVAVAVEVYQDKNWEWRMFYIIFLNKLSFFVHLCTQTHNSRSPLIWNILASRIPESKKLWSSDTLPSSISMKLSDSDGKNKNMAKAQNVARKCMLKMLQ